MAKPSPNKPSSDELRSLYIDQRLSAESIADSCKVQKITVLRWLRAAGVERRAGGRGLANRGVEQPTADDLRRMVWDEHLSYRQIAERYGVDFTAVPHWLRKHDIETPSVWDTRRKGVDIPEPTADELRAMIESGLSLNFIAADLGLSHGTIAKRCKDYGIEYRDSGWKGGWRLTCKDGHPARSVYEQRVDNWLTKHGIDHEIEPAYPWDQRYRADFLARGVYVEVWGVTHNPAYRERKDMKIERCREAGLPLVQIDHWQFAQGRKWWRPLQRALN